jgi:hypothetical protein
VSLPPPEECTICLEEFTDAAIAYKLKCQHYFHVDCINQWGTESDGFCPMCRKKIEPAPESDLALLKAKWKSGAPMRCVRGGGAPWGDTVLTSCTHCGEQYVRRRQSAGCDTKDHRGSSLGQERCEGCSPRQEQVGGHCVRQAIRVCAHVTDVLSHVMGSAPRVGDS